MKKNVRLTAIGDLSRLREDAYNTLQECIDTTSANTGTTLVLALSYSSRWEITRAARQLAQEVLEQKINPNDITEAMVSDHLTTKNIPDPDLLIRTGGEKRISNFLLWQLSYAEFFFTDVFWPDFREEELSLLAEPFREEELPLLTASFRQEPALALTDALTVSIAATARESTFLFIIFSLLF